MKHFHLVAWKANLLSFWFAIIIMETLEHYFSYCKYFAVRFQTYLDAFTLYHVIVFLLSYRFSKNA